MLIKLNFLFKLKLLNLYYILNINKKNSTLLKNLNYTWAITYYFKHYLLNSNQIYFSRLKLNNNLKSLSFFKLSYINSLLFYNLFCLKKKLINLNSESNQIVSNYSPYTMFFFYNKFLSNSVIGKNNYYKHFYQNNLYFIRFFIIKYLSLFLQDKNFYLNLQKNNVEVIEKNFFYKILLKKTKNLGFLKEIKFKVKSFINVILISLYNKDITLLKNVIKYILENLHFKKHKRFLYNLKVILKSIAYVFFYRFQCLGLYIKIKGKVGVGGNSKKRKYIFKLGSFSFTKKSQKLSYVKDSIRTYSGVLGFESYLTYK